MCWGRQLCRVGRAGFQHSTVFCLLQQNKQPGKHQLPHTGAGAGWGGGAVLKPAPGLRAEISLQVGEHQSCQKCVCIEGGGTLTPDAICHLVLSVGTVIQCHDHHKRQLEEGLYVLLNNDSLMPSPLCGYQANHAES